VLSSEEGAVYIGRDKRTSKSRRTSALLASVDGEDGTSTLQPIPLSLHTILA
jgi:hypothetical protein